MFISKFLLKFTEIIEIIRNEKFIENKILILSFVSLPALKLKFTTYTYII